MSQLYLLINWVKFTDPPKNIHRKKKFNSELNFFWQFKPTIHINDFFRMVSTNLYHEEVLDQIIGTIFCMVAFVGWVLPFYQYNSLFFCHIILSLCGDCRVWWYQSFQFSNARHNTRFLLSIMWPTIQDQHGPRWQRLFLRKLHI